MDMLLCRTRQKGNSSVIKGICGVTIDMGPWGHGDLIR